MKTEAPTPRINIVDPHTHLSPEPSNTSPVPSQSGQFNSDKRRRSGGSISKVQSEELKAIHDEERAHLRRLIQDKRRQTPQQESSQSEVVVLVNKDYDSYVLQFKQEELKSKAWNDAKSNYNENYKSPSPTDGSIDVDMKGVCAKAGHIPEPWTDNFRATASPISRRKITMELDEEVISQEGQNPKSFPSESESLEEPSAFDLLDDPTPSISESQEDGFLGQSFVTELQENPIFIDPQAALEYSMMLDQMQQILQLPTKHHVRAPDQELDQILEEDENVDGEDDEIEEGFEEESIKLEVSDDEDEFNEVDENEDELEVIQPSDPALAFDENDDMLLAESDLYITGRYYSSVFSNKLDFCCFVSLSLVDNDPFGNTLADLTKSLKGQANAVESANEYDSQKTALDSERQYVMELENRLISVLGKGKYDAGIGFLSSTLLVDEATDDDQLLSMLEEIIGPENLQYLEDLYQIISYHHG